TLLTACYADPVLLGQMVAAFHNDVPAYLKRVAAAVQDREAAALREAAHTLRGLVSAFSSSAAAAALRLEQAGATGQLDGAAVGYAELANLVAGLDAVLPGLSVAYLQSQVN